MRSILLFAGVVVGTWLASASVATAASYPWCAHYGYDLAAPNCGFTSFDQCMGALSGNGGSCVRNPQYRAPAREPARRRPGRPQ
jgi:hypothetical protein